MLEIVNAALKSFVAIMVLFVLCRLMGKKSIAQLTFFDYIVGTTIGSIAAALSADHTIKYAYAVTSLIVWFAFFILVSLISLKSIHGRRFLGSVPTILIQNGHIIETNLKKERFNINDFLEELRLKGAFNVADVEFAILETNGEISVKFKSQKQPLTPSDLNIPTDYEGLSASLIIDGVIMNDNLKLVNLNEKWLMDELNRQNVKAPNEVLLGSLDTKGKLSLYLKKSNEKEMKILE
ncbi:MAG TPA: DUF421 domain-containing protein [Clostridia bacterium]|nr:DUF421 domain-containing protein [Clostridia bacterium]